jgi:phosphoribosylformylglycinamidine synthase
VLHAFAFGEDQGRYLVTTADCPALVSRAEKAGIPAAVLGRTGGAELTLEGAGTISVVQLKAAFEGWLPAYMGDGVA